MASAFGALLVTSLLSIVAYAIVRSALLEQRDREARGRAFANANVMRGVVTRKEPFSAALDLLPRDRGSWAYLVIDSRVYVPGVVQPPFEALPQPLRVALRAGRTGRQRYEGQGQSLIAVAVALGTRRGAYVEVSPNQTLERTLTSIRTALVIGSAIAALGGAALGASTSRRVLQPLTRVSGASEALARGGLGTRLPIEDDNDLARLVDSFNRMADALQARIQREARFASDVSHELRTPLMALSASSEVLAARREELPERSQKALDILLSQLRRFDRMVLDLLEISRLDAGAADVHLEPIPVRRFLERVVGASGYGGVPMNVSSAVSTLVVDRRRLERIVVNLLENAKVHGGGPTALTVRAVGSMVEFAVDDAGPGVPEGERERIFERFARGTGARFTQGSGLGLAIVAEHARALGGTLRVEDRPGSVGARFVLALPRREEI